MVNVMTINPCEKYINWKKELGLRIIKNGIQRVA